MEASFVLSSDVTIVALCLLAAVVITVVLRTGSLAELKHLNALFKTALRALTRTRDAPARRARRTARTSPSRP